MSQRVVLIVGGCLLLGAGVLIGQSSNVVRNDEARFDQNAEHAGRLKKLDYERRAFESRQARDVAPTNRQAHQPVVRKSALDVRPLQSTHSDQDIHPLSVIPKRYADIALAGAPPKVADPFSDETAPPGPLPRHPGASPIREKPLHESPQELDKKSQSLRDIIREELPDAPEAEIDWYAKRLKGESPHAVKNILEMRRVTGSLLSNKNRKPLLPRNTLPKAVAPQRKLPPFPTSLAPAPPVTPIFEAAKRAPEVTIPVQLQPTVKSLRTAQKILLNNIANANTPAFKRTRINFADMPYQRMPSSGAQVGQGVSIVSTQRDWQAGPLRQTDRSLDVAIDGKGFFQLGTGVEIQYTRCGRLSIDADRNLVFMVGSHRYLLEPSVNVPDAATRIDISEEGNIVAVFPAGPPSTIGQFQIAQFPNPDGLSPLGNSMFAVTKKSGDANVGAPSLERRIKLKQGFLESSNVDLKRELARLRSVTQHLQAIQDAANLVNGPPELHLQELPISPPLAETPSELKLPETPASSRQFKEPPPVKRPTYRSLMNDAKRRTKASSTIKTSSLRTTWNNFDFKQLWTVLSRSRKEAREVSDKAREIERNLGIDH